MPPGAPSTKDGSVKVVHVHRLRGVGGSERHLLTLLPALRERGIDATFVGLDDEDPDPFYVQLDKLGVPYSRLRAPRDIDPVLAVRLRRAFTRARPDIVHTHLVHADVYGSVTAGRSTIVSTKHNDDPFRLGPFRHVERLCGRRAKRIIGITGALAHFNIERVGLPADKVSVVYYGLDDLPAAWGPPGGPTLPPDARILLAVSRLEEQKGLNVAIEALVGVRQAHPERRPRGARVRLAGGRADRPGGRARRCRCGLPGRQRRRRGGLAAAG